MKRISLIWFSIFAASLFSSAQNLVVNPSFENISSCDLNVNGVLNYATGWTAPTLGTSDLYNSCSFNELFSTPDYTGGYQQPRTGVGFGALIVYIFGIDDEPYREYVTSSFSSPLEAGITYEISFWIVLKETSQYANGSWGLAFANGNVFESTITIPVFMPPQVDIEIDPVDDFDDWNLVTALYIAEGGEDHMTIGNFKGALETNWTEVDSPVQWPNYRALYLIDDVSVCKFGADCSLTDDLPKTVLDEIRISPNPSEGRISVEGRALRGATYNIYNSLGQSTSQGYLNSSKEELFIDQPGVYMLIIVSGEQVIEERLIVSGE